MKPSTARTDSLDAGSCHALSKGPSGDAEALAALLARARPVVYRWAFSRLEDSDDAEDVTQAVLCRVWSGISSFRGDSKFSSWLYRITANEVGVHWRREARRQLNSDIVGAVVHGTPTQPRGPEQIEDAELCGLVRSVACALPALQLAAFRLVDLDGLRPCEAAGLLGRSQTNVRSSLCRARQRIRELVSRAGQDLAR
jgi:RNA polymerase sigma-70 factor (ECF subfamily)